VPLTPPATQALHPTYSWDGRFIVYAAATGQLPPAARPRGEEPAAWDGLPAGVPFNLFLMAADGSGVRQLTSGPFRGQRPSFSPDRRTVVFVSDRLGPRQLWTVATESDAAPSPLQREGWGYRPWYAADGQSIFFFTEVAGRHHICRIPAEGGAVTPLPNDTFWSSHGPFAVPDGQALLIHATATAAGPWGIWELPLDVRAPWQLHPPSVPSAGHATRARNGVVVFDSGVAR
jgi:Tol biopolymer transport system component